MPLPAELPPEALRRVCDPEHFRFETTAGLPRLSEVLGQPRALAALDFGTAVASHGFNLFALGLPGSGRTTLVREFLTRRAAGQPAPPDMAYVHNFADGRRPLKLQLPAGQGVRLQQDLAALVRELQDAIPRAFETKEYGEQRDQLVHKLEAERHQAVERLESHVARFGFQLLKTPGGLLLAPVVNGALITDDDLEKLNGEQRVKLAQLRQKLGEDIEVGLRQVRELERGIRDALHALDIQTASFAIHHLLDDLRSHYRDAPEVLAYLDAVQADVIDNADLFRKGREKEAPPVGLPPGTEDSPFTRYEVNVLVDNSGLHGAPVVVESNPTYHNLIGRIEHRSAWGGVATNFTLIKPGALHRANGGYLIIPARECLLNPYAWEGLKRALKDRAVRIEELGTQLSLLSSISLEPEPVSLDVKVVLIGTPAIYDLLLAYDEDFHKLFKIKADFTSEMPWTAEAEQAYALFVNTIVSQEGGRAFQRDAVARIVEYGARLAGDQAKLTTRLGEIADLIREAAFRSPAGAVVTAADVRAAEAARRFRSNLLEERFQEAITRGALLIETAGAAVGQVNGLALVALGDYDFGHPARITATVGPGQRGVLSIEREVELSGPIHGKGVLILSGYLLRQYGAAAPLSLAASLVFEQAYGLVEGDSASLAELYALLSALAGCPLRQDVAVTGSVNQLGQVQPVGAVTEKAEGFFDICAQRGLTGRQGVLIPAANRAQLMLRDDVVAAVGAGQFHLWPAETVDDGLALLTGRPAGQRTRRGGYPGGSLHHAVVQRLAEFARALKERPPRPRRPARA